MEAIEHFLTVLEGELAFFEFAEDLVMYVFQRFQLPYEFAYQPQFPHLPYRFVPDVGEALMCMMAEAEASIADCFEVLRKHVWSRDEFVWMGQRLRKVHFAAGFSMGSFLWYCATMCHLSFLLYTKNCLRSAPYLIVRMIADVLYCFRLDFVLEREWKAMFNVCKRVQSRIGEVAHERITIEARELLPIIPKP